MQLLKSKIKFRSELLMHIAFTKNHVGKYKLTLYYEGHPMHGLEIIHETNTPKDRLGNFLKQENTYYLNKPNSKSYSDLWELLLTEQMNY